MISKQDILNAILKTAKENDGKPLGIARFEKETGIKPYDWGKYWARFGNAQKEAGFMPNQLRQAHAVEFIIEKVIALIRKLEKFPTLWEIVVERNNDPELPSKGTFQRLGTKEQLANKVIAYCRDKTGYDDVIELCRPFLEKSTKEEKSDNADLLIGEVYLFKSGRYYKIGKTNDTVRRGNELRIQLPEKMDLIHAIKTDDPSGIEVYWHRRFESKKTETKSEWFDLNTTDVKAFKRWRRIV